MSSIQTAADVFTGITAVMHVYFMVMEMFLWRNPVAMKVFGTTPETVNFSATLAANIGIYNSFVAGGLFYSIAAGYATDQLALLSYVMIAGAFGAISSKITILFAQFLPALIAYLLALFGNRFSDPRYNMALAFYSEEDARKWALVGTSIACAVAALLGIYVGVRERKLKADLPK